MIVKELLTKLSYIVDDKGFKQYKANEQKLKQNKKSNIKDNEKEQIASDNRVYKIRANSRKKELTDEQQKEKILKQEKIRNLKLTYRERYDLIRNTKNFETQKDLEAHKERLRNVKMLLRERYDLIRNIKNFETQKDLDHLKEMRRNNKMIEREKYDSVRRIARFEETTQNQLNRQSRKNDQSLYNQRLKNDDKYFNNERKNQQSLNQQKLKDEEKLKNTRLKNEEQLEQKKRLFVLRQEQKQQISPSDANQQVIDRAGTIAGRTAVVSGGGILGMSVQAMRIDKVLKQLMGQGKLTARQANELRNVSIKESNRTGVSQLGIISGQAELVRAGLSMKDIKNFTGMILDFQKASKSKSFEEAATFATDMYFTYSKISKDPKKNAQEMQKTLDILTQGLLTSKLDIDDYTESLKYSAANAKAAGMGLDKLTVFLAVLAQAGIKGSVGGTALRRMLSELPQLFGDVSEYSRDTKKQKHQRDVISKLGIKNAYTKDGNFDLISVMNQVRPKMQQMGTKDRLATAESLVGMTGKTAFSLISMLPEEEYQRIIKDMKEYQGSTKQVSDIMRKDFASSVDRARSALTNFTTSLGDELLPLLKPLLENFTKALISFNDLPKWVKTGIVWLGLFTTGVSSAFVALKTFMILWSGYELLQKTSLFTLAAGHMNTLKVALMGIAPYVWSIGAGFATWVILPAIAAGIGLLIGELINFMIYGKAHFAFWEKLNGYIKKMFGVDLALALTNFRNMVIREFTVIGDTIYNWYTTAKNYLMDLFGFSGNMSVSGTVTNQSTKQIVSAPKASSNVTSKTFIFNNKSNVGVNLTNQNIRARDVAGQISNNITGSNRSFWSEVAKKY